MIEKASFERVGECCWEIPASARHGMRVPARVIASESLLEAIGRDRSLDQLVNVAMLPGIAWRAIVMPDAHEGYGFPIGGVAAFDPDEGVISPGGIGYDINCGVRLLRSQLSLPDVAPRIKDLVDALNREVPSGVGRGGALRLGRPELDKVFRDGASRMVETGWGEERDLASIESGGRIEGADARAVSDEAARRGRDQLGTMGAGNHFIEVDVVERIFDEETACRLGLDDGLVTILIHTGSRGLGHQIATDSLRIMQKAMPRHGISIPDRELACVPFRSEEGQRYFRAMAAGANFAFANRQAITAEARKAWSKTFGASGGSLDVVYDVAHNIAKIEEHRVEGHSRKLVVHRKGATRAFPGQPVLIPGSMGTGSYVLVGRESAMAETFGSTCHGAGRTMSRTKARREIDARELVGRLERSGITIHGGSAKGLVEEAPEAYKDIDAVVDVVDRIGIATRVARLRPVGVVKG